MWKVLAWVLVVFAVLLSIAVPDLMHALDRGRQKRSMADMRAIATALEARAMKVNSYSFGTAPSAPVTASALEFGALRRVSLDELERALVPVYIRKLPRRDGWGKPFDVRIGAYDAKGRAQLYALRSYGSDGKPDGETYANGVIEDLRGDLVFADGTFLRYPEGI